MKIRFRTRLGRVLCSLICLILIFGTTAVPFTVSADLLTVKVGFFAFDGYHEQDKNGIRSGYGYEFLQHLAGYAGICYEYVGYDKNWSEMQDMLERGEIDILTSAQKTPEREALFDFTETNIGVSAAILTAQAGDRKFSETDYANWNGIRVGMIEGNSRNDNFASYALENGFTYKPVYFDDTDEMIAELQSESADKKVDAILTSNLRRIENEWVLAQFDSSPFFIMVKKGNAELLTRLNNAIAKLDLSEPGLRTKLMNKYYTAGSNDFISFSPEERAYIDSMQGKTLTALINPDRAPYSYYKNGVLTGIAFEAAQDIITRSGLKIKFIEAKTMDEYCSKVDSNEEDILFEIADSYNQAEANGYWLTDAFITVPMARVYRKDTTVFKTAAEPINRDISNDYITTMRELGVEPTYYDSITEVVDAVMSRKCDVSYLAMDTATMAIRDDVTNRLICEEVFGLVTSYSVAVRNTQNPLLFSILNKAAASIGDNEIDTIRQTYAASMEKPFSLIGYCYDYPMNVTMIILIVLGIGIFFIVLAFQRSKRKAEHLHLKKEREQNELLTEALGAAEKAGAAKSQFLSRVSHEMRTPLNAIVGFVELAKNSDKEQMENYLGLSELAAKQLLNVINDVLDMSSIESGKLKIANAPFNFKRLISSVTNIYGTQCKQKNIEFETKITTPVDDWQNGDEMRVNQILMNLLGNAVKFTQEGHIWLTISQKKAENGKSIISFAISDTGCGMSEEMKERLFKPFEQESATTAKKYGGSGLGLSIVKNLADKMGGTVKVESKQGVGTTFIVELPFEKSDVENKSELPEKIENLRILAVDDEETERKYIGEVLSRMGARFTCVASGKEALDAMAESETKNDLYNVCLIDWRMPGLDGVDITEMIRKKYGKEVILIVVSAYDFQQVSENAKKAGANLFISKPIFQSTLFDLLMTLTNGEFAKPKQEVEKYDFAGRRVLLAEDNTLNQILVNEFLQRCNIVVDMAENGQVAVDKFTESKPGYYDAILMDIQMPVMDGYEATRIIRQSSHPEAKTIHIIAQSADAFSEDVQKALSAGMNAHIAKPIKLKTLADLLNNAFECDKNNA